MVNKVYAQDNFELVASKSDSMGTEANSEYILKSKEPVKTKLIKENLKFDPVIDYKIKEVSDTEWKIIPQKLIEPNTILKAKLKISYLDESEKQNEYEYSWVYQIKDTFKVIHSIPGQATTNVPLTTGIEITFSHDNFSKEYQKYFSIEPIVKGKFEKHGRTLVFVPKGSLLERTLYTVTMKKGFSVDGSDEVLLNDYSVTFETQSSSPNKSYRTNWFAIYRKLYDFNSQEKPVINIHSNQGEFNFQTTLYQFRSAEEYMKSLAKRDQLPWWSSSKDNYQPDVSNLNKISDLDLNLIVEDNSKYLEFPEKLSVGHYLIQLKDGDKQTSVWIQISDISAYTNILKNKSIVWVNSLKSGTAIGGAKIELLNTKYSYQTDKKGIASFNTPDILLNYANDKNIDPQYFKISSGNDQLIIPANRVSRYYRENSYQDKDDYWYYLYTDRPRYQTTDKIQFWGMLKKRNGQEIGNNVKLILYKKGYVDYWRKPINIQEKVLEISDIGTFQGSIDFKDLRSDYYNLAIEVDGNRIYNKYLSIKSYEKPAYQIDLIPDKKATFAGEEIKFKGKASFFEGTAVPGLELVFQKPNGQTETKKTDAQGEVEFIYTEDYQEGCKGVTCWPRYRNFVLSPKDGENTSIKANVGTRFYGPKVYLKNKLTYPETGVAELDIKSYLIDIDSLQEKYSWGSRGDEIAPQTKLKIELRKIIYEKKNIKTKYNFISKRTYQTYDYVRREEVVDQLNVSTNKQGEYKYKIDVESETSYQVKIKFFDQEGRMDSKKTHIYYYDGRIVNVYDNVRHYYKRLLSDKNTYSIGDEVQVSFMQNEKLLPEGENYLLLQLQNGLQEYSISNNPQHKFSFEERDAPNVALRGIHFNGSAYSFIHSNLVFNKEDKVLDIEIKLNKDSYEPGEKVKALVEVKDLNGQPVSAKVNLNLVDEAFYAVVDTVADPLSQVYRSIGSGSIFSYYSHNPTSFGFGGAEKGGCFLEGTQISMADGSTKSIEDIKVGDQIMTFDNILDQKMASGRVSEVFKHIVPNYLIINNDLKLTPEHLIYSNGKFKEAGFLEKGDWIINKKGEKIAIESIEIINEIVTVYNFRVDPQHTYFAQGYYVHNDKGGTRETFVDTALFKEIQTNRSGQAEIEFELPDNITSWRITTQAITNDLQVGVKVNKLPVSLDVFADINVAKEYLADDQPIAKLRAYGRALNSSDQAVFTVSVEGENNISSLREETTAFMPAYLKLPDLDLGKHNLLYTLKTDKGSDIVKLPVEIINSRLESQHAHSEKLSVNTQIKPQGEKLLVVVLMDEGQNSFYDPLLSISRRYGDRSDQKLASQEARKVLAKIYDYKPYFGLNFTSHAYQTQDGSLSLLPYSSGDLELSVRMALLKTDSFDQESLAQYFFKKLENKNSNYEEISLSLAGLASLEKPVLPRIYQWLEKDDLEPIQKLYLAQGLYNLGDIEKSQEILEALLVKYGEIKDPNIILRVNDDLEDVFKATSLAAVLAGALDMNEHQGLWNYLINNHINYGDYRNSERLLYLEKVSYIKNRLNYLHPNPAKIEYILNGKKKKINLTGNKVHSFSLMSQDVDHLKFTHVEGDVGVSTRYTAPINLSNIKTDPNIKVSRRYYVNGQETTTFKESDNVSIRIDVSFEGDSLKGEYQITDFLPSNLIPATKVSYSHRHSCTSYRPYSIDHQKVNFKFNSKCKKFSINYQTKVKTTGRYKAEPVLVQSFLNPNLMNYSETQTIITK
ncbi:Ig-like domain-containing protein [bacterium]|nr:Ig-like domain-containing protein [bacterium]